MTTGASTTTTGTSSGTTATETVTGSAGAGAKEPNIGAGGGTATSTETELSLGTPAPEKKPDEKTQTTEPGKKPEGEKANAPKPLELKLPDGFTKDDVVVKDFTSDATELGLDAEKAQKLFDKHVVKGRESFREAISGELTDGIEAQVKEWEGALRTDKEFGGAKFAENFEIAKQGLEKFGTPALKQFLYETGLGTHPEIVRAFYHAGLATAEDSSSGTGGGGGSAPLSPEAQMFPTMFKKKE